jgi:hypothetical protein
LWFIGRPPSPETLARQGVGQPADRVIAWFLDDEALENDPGYAERWAGLVRQRDVVAGRPVITAPQADWKSASNTADVLLAARPRMAFSSKSEYQDWLASRGPLIRAGTPLWACLPTQFPPAVGRQISALSGDASAITPSVSTSQLNSLVEIASAHAMRGIAFCSETSLNATDAATRARANGLEIMNRRLQQLEPWLASGKVLGRFPSVDGEWSGIVLHHDRARLLMLAPRATSPRSTKRGNEEVTFVVPGVPESCQVFLLTPVAMKTLPTQRIAGGTRIAFRPANDAYVLLTEDPKVVQSLRQQRTRNGERIVRLLRESAALKSAQIAESVRRLAQVGSHNHAVARTAATAAAQLQQVDAGLASRRVEHAHEVVIALHRMLEDSAAQLQSTVTSPNTLSSNPLSVCEDRLGDFAAFERARPSFQFGDNLLYGGDFEDVGQLTQLGWRHSQNPVPGVDSRTELSIDNPRHGNYCLIMQAAAENGLRPQLDGATLWIASAPLPVDAGQIVEITGWARVDAPFTDSGDGLQIVDSLGGPELALSISKTKGWEQFRLIRAVPEPTELRLTFAVAGLGTARIDAVMVRPIVPPADRRLPGMAPASGVAAGTAPTAVGPLLLAPSGEP